MRLALLLFALLANEVSLAGQSVSAPSLTPQKPAGPAAGSLPFRFSLVPGLMPQAAEEPGAGRFPYRFSLAPGLLPQAPEKPAAPARPGAGWFFRDWKQLLPPEPVMIAGHGVQFEAGRCVIPLLRVPLPAHYDDEIVRRLGWRGNDQPMVWTPPPDCPLSAK